MNMTRESILNNVQIKAINYYRNRDYLMDKPHVRLEDLAGVFYVPIDENEFVIITEDIAALSGLTTEELENAAKANGKFKVTTIAELLGLPDCEPTIYVVTTKNKVYGAGAMFYPDVFAAFTNAIGGDMYILPSSIHEVLAIKVDNGNDSKFLLEMVKQINATEVRPDEVLSDNVYYYDAREKVIREG